MAPAKKTTKKTNGLRSRKYGCVTYNSEPQDNPDCHKGRCSPPARMVSSDGTTKVTQIRYRRRNLDVVSKNCACSLKPASKTKKAPAKAKAKAPAKVKAPAKPKAPAKTKAPAKAKAKAKAPSIAPVMPKLSKKDVELFGERLAKAKAKVKAPAKAKAPTKADAEKIITRLTKNAGFKNVSFRWEQSRKISDLGWVRGTGKEAGDFKWLLSTKLASLTPMAIQDITDKVLKRIKSGKNEQFRPATVMDLRKHGLKLPNYDQNGHLIGDVGSIREKTVKETVKIPGTKNAAVKKAILDKSSQDGMNAKELSKHLVVASVPKQTAKKEPVKAPIVAPVPAKAEKKAPQKKAPQKKAPQKKTAIVGTRFDQVNLRNSLAFLKKLNGRYGYIPVPIFRHSMTYVDPGHICMVKITSRVPDKSIMGLPLSRTNQDAWVPQDNLYDRLNKDVTGVRYSDGKMYFDWDMPGGGSLSTSTKVNFDYGDVNNLVKLPPMFTRREDGDHVFRTTQARFAADVKKVATYTKIPRPGKYDDDGSVQLCPMGKVSKPEEGAPTPKGCSTYSEAYLHAIAEFIAKAKNGSCVVIHRDKYPLKVICDCGQYVTEIFLAPQWRTEDSE